METIIHFSATDPVPPANSSTPAIVYGVVLRSFVAALGTALLIGGASAHATWTPDVVRSISASPTVKVSRKALEQLRKNWMDPEATQVSDVTIRYAEELLAGLPHLAEHPHLSASADGEIGFTWVVGIDRIEALLDAEDHLTWVAKVGGKFMRGGDILISSFADWDVFYRALRDFYGRA